MALLERKDVVVIRPVGCFNSDSFKGVETTVLKGLDHGVALFVVNWSQVDELTPAGLRLLVLLNELVKNKKGRMVHCSISADSKKKFEDEKAHFSFYRDEEEAYLNP